MAVGRIIVLSALFVEALSAPSGCIESCNFYESSHSSYQSRQTSGGSHLDHAGLIQGTLNEQDYARPGNWTERNQYGTSNGQGKVHEERGQYVEGSKRVRYYKKNFTSSYGTGNVPDGAVELDRLSGHREYESLHLPSSQHLDSQSAYVDQVGASSVTKESGYSRVQSQQQSSSSRRIDGQSERLEDFGEYGYSQVNRQRGQTSGQTSGHQRAETSLPENWSRVDAYRTDGGRGRVYEEEGQYVTGPKKVSYYKKNYTSSYSTSPQVTVGSLPDLQQELRQNLHEQLDGFRRQFHQTSNVGQVATVASSASSLTQETAGLRSDDLQTAESDAYRQQLTTTQHRVPSTVTHHYAGEQQQRETFAADTSQHAPSYTYPSAGAYGTESQRTYQSHETYVSRAHPTPQPTHSSQITAALSSSGYVQRPVIGDYRSQNAHSSGLHAGFDEAQRAIVADSLHRASSAAQNQLFENSQRVYYPDRGTYPGGRGRTTHYEEHWSSSSRADGNPDRSASYGADRTHYDRVAYNEHLGRYHDAARQGYDSQTHTGGAAYNSGYRATSGQLVTGSADVGQVAHGAADCTEETHQHYQQESRYHRKYKRDGQQRPVRSGHDDLAQQHRQFGQESQQVEDLTQQTLGDQHLEDFTQQTSGKLELGQQTIGGQHSEDLTQQTEGFEQQTAGSDDFTQQTSGKLELGQQTIGGQHSEDLTQQTEGFEQQTAGSDDFTQQTSGKLELGQQTIGGQHLEDLMQQIEQLSQRTERSDFTQQTSGKLELGQQTIGDQHLEDLTQQTEGFEQQTAGSDDFTQQTSGKLELGQQTIGGHHSEDLTQQNGEFGRYVQVSTLGKPRDQYLEELRRQMGDFRQQTEGNDEYTQQTMEQQSQQPHESGNQDLEDFTQQNEDWTQQAGGSHDFTQQTMGHLEVGQQQHRSGNKDSEDFTQQNEDWTQQAGGSHDFTQQTMGHLEVGQQQQQHRSRNKDSEDFTQQNEDWTQQAGGSHDFTQQTMGHLEVGQQQHRSGNKDSEDFTQQNEDWTQQAGGSHDFTQQTMGRLEFGQQQQQQHRSRSQHLEDFTQQNEDFLTQQVGRFDDFAHQTPGHLERGQQIEQEQKPGRSRYDAQYSEHPFQQSGWDEELKWQLEQMSQKADPNEDFTQQADRDGQSVPASKPKPRQRYPKYSSNPSRADVNAEDVSKPIEINPEADINDRGTVRYDSHATHPKSDDLPSQGSNGFDNEKENIDRLHWVHKSNDATVGLQWHYTYHPSDLTNVESSHNVYYPEYNSMHSQQTEQRKPVDFTQQQQQETQKPTFEVSPFNSQLDQNSEYIPSRVIPLQHSSYTSQQATPLDKQSGQNPGQTELKMESRILEVFGGAPYTARNDDIYRRVTPNPSATLPPVYGEEAWDVREKPRGRTEVIPWSITRKPATDEAEDARTTETETTTTAETTTQVAETTTKEEDPPSFWARVGNKITNTYDKAKEKAREIFG
ncbi:PREDICTED: uncharacterized protein LOC106751799 isoform X2 [Dinoponera quadriceps]|uniref:Uncharacterized protein LOC106751799 isoform X2 n=1 Tax=Dinoponera quadriceps TaxID=609295 RepID=A0A6P3YF70_DINQU|nr:PREDICTED: uncharacterized protein LOC106751799 isoform X2 [Dinoponera quadriceps]